MNGLSNIDRNLLSFAIPTYNRAEILSDKLDILIDVIKEYQFSIYISDNASMDDTETVIKKKQINYPYLYYFKNEKNIKDLNFHKVLKYSTTKYTWLLADYTELNSKCITNIIKIINNKDFDVVVVNGDGRVKDCESGVFTDANELLKQLGWHMTWLSALIFSQPIINGGYFERYYGTSFTQLASIFEYLAFKEKIKVYFAKDILFNPTDKRKKNAWSSDFFEIMVKNFEEVIFSLPNQYSLENKVKCIKRHGKNSNILNIKTILILRAHGYIKRNEVVKYKEYIKIAINFPFFILLILSLFSQKLLLFLLNIRGTVLGRKRINLFT